MIVEGVRTSINDLSQSEIDDLKALITNAFDIRAEATHVTDYCITTDVLLEIANQVLSDKKYYYVKRVLAAYRSNFYKEYGIRWAAILKVEYSTAIKNIFRNSVAEIPDKIFRFENGELFEPNKIYKVINGELILFWEK